MTHTTLPRVAPEPAPEALWRGLLDDAAVFPPGNTPWPQAVERHGEHRAAWYADAIGPLLLPAATIADLAAQPPTQPVDLVVIARPGVGLDATRQAVTLARTIPGVTVAGTEIPYTDAWRSALDWAVPLAVEVPAGEDIEAAVRELADGGSSVRAKLRTGATPTIPLPTPDQLALFLVACATHGVAGKLTGGLHHAVGTPGEEYGFLAVLLAAHAAATAPTHAAAVRDLLGEHDPTRLATAVAALTGDDVLATRSLLTAYGCCDVTDPITDLTELGLIDHATTEGPR